MGSEQSDFSSFNGDERPAAEAAAVAGDGDGGADVVELEDRRFPDADGRVELAVTQVDYTIEGRGPDEHPILHVFGRTADRDREHVRVYGFDPYFYVPLDTLDREPGEPLTAGDITDDRLDIDGLRGIQTVADRRADGHDVDPERDDNEVVRYESIRGEELVCVLGRTPRDVGQARDRFDHYEADILFPNRLLIDKDIKSGIRVPARRGHDDAIHIPHREIEPVEATVEPRVNTFDIEVDDRNGFPEDGEEPILCLTSHDSYRDEYVVWLYQSPDGVDGPNVLEAYEPIGDEFEADVRTFTDEGEMLEAFITYLQETDADVISGWNVDDFDAPYLIDRMEELGLDSDRLSRVDEVWRSDWQGPNVKGRVVFDLLYAYKRTQFSELESYRLDAVAETELGVGKERYSGDIGDLWEQNPERLLEYNLRDVELCVELDRKQDIIAFWNDVRTFVGCSLEDAPTPGDVVDMYLLHEVHGRFALPSKGQQESEDFEGGAVFEPISGVKEMVSVLDLASLYPMAMVTLNASPETKVGADDFDGETFRAPNGQQFRKEPDGVMREMVDELLGERERLKKERDRHDPGSGAYEQHDRQQAATKVIMNCFTPDTEVLTPSGIRRITDLEVGDLVLSLNPETMEMERKPVVETQSYPNYRGDLLDIETTNIDFRVTPTHRMLVRKDDTKGSSWGENDYRFIEAGDLDPASRYQLPHGWAGPDGERLHEFDLTGLLDEYEIWANIDVKIDTLADEIGWYPDKVLKNDIGETGYVFSSVEFETHREYLETVCSKFYIHSDPNRPWIPRFYEGDDFLDLLAWYITNGHVYSSKETWTGETVRSSSTTVGITRDAISDGGEPTHVAVGELLDGMELDYDVDSQGYHFTSPLLGQFLEETCGRDSTEKHIPEFVFDTCRSQKRRFLDTLIAGNGDRQSDNSWRLTTSSERLRDDVLRLCAHVGLTAHYSYESGSWRIYCTEDSQNTLQMHRSSEPSTAEEGVYCVTVKDNHTLLAGRNGTFQFVGQSLYGVSGWDRFRLYDKENAAAITATGRRVIEFTAEAVDEMGYEVTYGDSVTGERPVVVRNPDGMVQILPIAELFERAAPGVDVVITADGGAVASTSPGKSRRTVEGWEALSVDEDGQAAWQPIRQIIRHQTDKQVVNLQHDIGESTTTRDHSYITEKDGTLEPTPPEDVTEPLRVPTVPDIDTVDTIDVYEVLDGSTHRDTEEGLLGEANAVSRTKRVYADEEYVWFGQEDHGRLDATIRVQRYIDVSDEAGRGLIRLLAAYLTEGSVSTEEPTTAKLGVNIAASRRESLEQLQEDYHRLFETTTATIKGDSGENRLVDSHTEGGNGGVTCDDETRKIQMMNELSVAFFQAFAGRTSTGKRIPSFVYHLPEDEQTLFLDGLGSGEGSRDVPLYGQSSAGQNFDFETTSRELAAGVSMLLTQRDTKHALTYRESTDSYTIRLCDHYQRDQAPVVSEVEHDGYVYDLDVAENDNFVDGVGGLVLHNTDSVMLSLGDMSEDAAIDVSFEIEEYINGRYDEFAREELNAEEHRFRIEFEKLYRRFFQAGKKKRYAGHKVWNEGKAVDEVDITGFEYKRSDIAPVTKEVQHEVLERIVHGEDVESIKAYMHDVIQEFQRGELPLEDVAIPGGIGKHLDAYDTDTAHVRGAKYANLLLGTNFARGSKPKRLYLEKVHPEFFRRVEDELDLDPAEDPLYGEFKRNPDVICFEYADQVPAEFAVDWEKMLDKTLKGPIARVLEALDVSWEEVKTGQEQTGLESFM